MHAYMKARPSWQALGLTLKMSMCHIGGPGFKFPTNVNSGMWIQRFKCLDYGHAYGDLN